MSKINCWEFKKCGREPGGINTAEMGVCKASVLSPGYNVNEGDKSGRYCWKVAGTLCEGEIQGSWAVKTHLPL